MNPTQKRILILILAAVFFLLPFQIVKNLRFRVTDTTPNIRGEVATDLKTFVLNFNRELAPNADYKQKLVDPQNHVKEIEAEPKRLIVHTNPPQAGASYKFELKDIAAADGSVIQSIKFDFVSLYVPFDKLPKDQQQLVEEQNNRPKTENPILNYLPHGDLHFKLNADFSEVNEESGEVGNLGLIAELYLSNADVKTDREAAVAKYKQEVLDYIGSIGFDPNDFTIRYEIIESS